MHVPHLKIKHLKGHLIGNQGLGTSVQGPLGLRVSDAPRGTGVSEAVRRKALDPPGALLASAVAPHTQPRFEASGRLPSMWPAASRGPGCLLDSVHFRRQHSSIFPICLGSQHGSTSPLLLFSGLMLDFLILQLSPHPRRYRPRLLPRMVFTGLDCYRYSFVPSYYVPLVLVLRFLCLSRDTSSS